MGFVPSKFPKPPTEAAFSFPRCSSVGRALGSYPRCRRVGAVHRNPLSPVPGRLAVAR